MASLCLDIKLEGKKLVPSYFIFSLEMKIQWRSGDFRILIALGVRTPSNKLESFVFLVLPWGTFTIHPIVPSKGNWLLSNGEVADDYVGPLNSCCMPNHGEMGLGFYYLVALPCVQSGGWSLSVVLESAKVPSLGGFPKTQYFSPKKQRSKPHNCLSIWANWLHMKRSPLRETQVPPAGLVADSFRLVTLRLLNRVIKLSGKREGKTCLQIFETHVYTVTAYFGNWTKISFVRS